MPSGKTPNFKLNEWDYSDKPSMPEFNRDNAIVDAELKRLWDSKADTTRSNWIFYVSKSGSDATADGTQANPFGTIQAAVNYAGSKVAGREKQILIGDGIYEEGVSAVGFDKLQIRSVSGHRSSVVIKPPIDANGIYLSGIAHCEVRDLTVRMPGGSRALYVLGGSVLVRNVVVTSDTEAYCGIELVTANGAIDSSEISRCELALYAVMGGTILSSENTGSGNKTVFYASGGTIFYGGTTPSGTTLKVTRYGGQVLS